jgi:hypothetical protein
VGVASSITGGSVTYAVGGVGSKTGAIAAGASNTGTGGSGTNNGATNTAGGGGGSGFVVIKIPDFYSATFTGGVTQTNATSGGFKVYQITAAGVADTVTFS